MTKIGDPLAQRTHQHHPEPDAAGVEHPAKAAKAAEAKKAAPAQHMSKTERAAVDGLVKHQTPKSRLQTIRAILAKNPGLADHYVAERLRGHNSVEHQIVHTVLARSGTTGIQRLAMCESAVRQIHGLGHKRQAEVLGLVTAGVSVHGAIAQLEAEAKADKAEATAKSHKSMKSKIDAAVKSLKHEAAKWKKTSDEVNALYRKVPRLSREAEVITGAVNLEVDIGDDIISAQQSRITGNPDYARHAFATARRNFGYVTGKLTKKVDEARTLYFQFSKQHIAYVEQNNRMQRAVESGDFQAQTDARTRMDKLAAGMKRTVAEFRPLAKEVAHLEAEFDKAVKHGAYGIIKQAVTVGVGGAPGSKAVEDAAGKVGGFLYDAVSEGAVTKGYEWATGSSDSD